MSNELQALKQELQHKGSHNRLQDEELISAMKEQVKPTHKRSSTCAKSKKPQLKDLKKDQNMTLVHLHTDTMNNWTCWLPHNINCISGLPKPLCRPV